MQLTSLYNNINQQGNLQKKDIERYRALIATLGLRK